MEGFWKNFDIFEIPNFALVTEFLVVPSGKYNFNCFMEACIALLGLDFQNAVLNRTESTPSSAINSTVGKVV